MVQEIRPDYTLKVKSDQMLTDNLSNVYLTQNDQIRKYTGKLELMKEFSNKNFGVISSADVTNSVPGGGIISIQVDPANLVRENNEGNNYASQHISVPYYYQY